jgi:uncharacterized membrane protein
VILALLVACGTPPADTADTAPTCDDVPVVSWNDYGDALLREHCQPCHASTTAERNGAPTNVAFDTYEDVVTHRDRILAVITSDPPTMPPAMALPDADRELLVGWLTCDVR